MPEGLPRYRGLTWDHPRGYRALETLSEEAQRAGTLILQWDRQPLEGFESQPLESLCETYDLLVIDHPHLGQALATGALRPLHAFFPPIELNALSKAFVGATYQSYVLDGVPWALPLDAATQVGAYVADALDEAAVPDSWDTVVRTAERQRVCLCLAGPHALLTLFSVLVGLGSPADESASTQFIDSTAGREALGLLSHLVRLAPKGWESMNPIDILDRMSMTGEVVYCPLIYGYVPYARRDTNRPRPLRFRDAPTGASGARGSTLGGTGLAITRRAVMSEALIEFLRGLVSVATQVGRIPWLDGQPARTEAWENEAVDQDTGGFYSATRRTMESAWVRPRYSGYIQFQTEASSLVRRAIAEGSDAASAIQSINAAYARSRETH